MRLSPTITKQLNEWAFKTLEKDKGGGLREWTPEIASQFQSEFDNHVEYLLDNKYFLNIKDTLYPSHRDDILKLYEEMKTRTINLAIFKEAIGAGKSTKMAVLMWLEWFRLTCKFNPQQYYGMMEDEIIAFISMNRSEAQARRVTLQKVFPKFQTEFNIEYFPPSKRRGQEIWIPRNNTLIFAGTSSAASALGYNIYGGVIDEANFLEIIEGGKRAQSAAGVYDAAQEMHDAMFNRMKSRFINPRTGNLDGLLGMISSARYPDDFLEKKFKEHAKLGKHSHMFVRGRTLWEAKPSWYFSGITVPFDIKSKRVLLSAEEIEDLKAQANIIMAEKSAKRKLEKEAEVTNAEVV